MLTWLPPDTSSTYLNPEYPSVVHELHPNETAAQWSSLDLPLGSAAPCLPNIQCTEKRATLVSLGRSHVHLQRTSTEGFFGGEVCFFLYVHFSDSKRKESLEPDFKYLP